MSKPLTLNNDLENTEFIFDKKKSTKPPESTFKQIYLSQNEAFSPFKIKEKKDKYIFFTNISSSIKKLISFNKQVDTFAQEKADIKNIVMEFINDDNYQGVNDFLQKGFVPDLTVVRNIVDKSSIQYVTNRIFTIQHNTPLHGILAQVLFTSKDFVHHCHDMLKKLHQHFPKEVLYPELFTENGQSYNKSYKNVYMSHDIGQDYYATAAINMHNSCLNPSFSLPLFSYCLKRVLNYKNYDSNKNNHDESWNMDSSLITLYSYIKKYFTQEDKYFICNMLESFIDPKTIKLIENEELPFCLNFFNTLHADIKSTIKPKYTEQDKKNLLDKVPEIYANEQAASVNRYHFIPLNINEDKLLPQHKNLVVEIKNIHIKLSGNEELLENEHIVTVNKIVSDTLPLTIMKYEKIDSKFRESVKNIEGKNANELLEESLNNMLVIMKDVELTLEQAKVNDLSIINRSHKIN